MSTRKQIEKYCKKNKLIKLLPLNLGGDLYYFDEKKNVVIKFSLFSETPTSFEIATKDEINEIIKSYELPSRKKSKVKTIKSRKRNSYQSKYVYKRSRSAS